MMSTNHLSQLIVVLVLLAGCSFAKFWQLSMAKSTTKSAQYYQTFQTVPPPEKTADKFMSKFLHFPVGSRTKRQTVQEDLVIVMDGSETIPYCEFEKGKKALKTIMDAVTTDVKYAVVTFSNTARVQFRFVRNPPAGDKLLRIAYPGGMTNTQAGLAEAKNLFQDPSAGARFFSRKVVLLVTDGQSSVEHEKTVPNAAALKSLNVEIFVVAVGRYIDGIDEIVKLASSPPEHFVFRLNTHNDFYHITRLILKKVKPDKYKIVAGEYKPPCWERQKSIAISTNMTIMNHYLSDIEELI